MAHDIAGPTLFLLGRFELRTGTQAVPLARSAKRVLAYLGITGSVLRREALAGRLWEWSSPPRAHANLRNALWRIRQADPRFVATDDDVVRLGSDLVVDLHVTSATARRLIDATAPCDMTAMSAGLFELDILPDWDDDWVFLERERHRQLRIHALEALSRWLADRGRFAEAIDTAYAALAAEPLRESAHLTLIQAYLAEGNRSEAVRQLAFYRRLLDDQLGLPPSPQIEALVPTGTPR